MPISRKIMFQCKKCSYKELRTIADVRPDIQELKPCPVCGSSMIEVDTNFNTIESIFKTFKRIFS